MFRHNFHTHTRYGDGSSDPEAYVRAAMNEGFSSLGFSEHAPVPFENNFAIASMDSLEEYCRDVRRLKNEYEGKINIYLALEADHIPGKSVGFDFFRDSCGLDYIIGSVHLVSSGSSGLWFIDGPERKVWQKGLQDHFNGNIRDAIRAYYHQINDMIVSESPGVIGHLDKVKMHNRGEYFSEDEQWYRDLARDTIQLAKENGSIIEVNTRGLYKKRSDALFPGKALLSEMKAFGIPVTISSDAHKPVEVGMLMDTAAEALLEVGYREAYVYDGKSWVSEPLV